MSIEIDQAAVRAAGLTLVGEPLAVDLVNTEKLAKAVPVELLVDDDAQRAFWLLESERVTTFDELPALDEVRSLRSAVRSLFESRLAGGIPDEQAVATVNRYASAAPSSPQLADGWAAGIHWQAPDTAAVLGTVARSAIDVLTGPDAARLHRCAADDCSMLFVATNAKRQWCTAAGCGNRHRVARHSSLERSRGASTRQETNR